MSASGTDSFVYIIPHVLVETAAASNTSGVWTGATVKVARCKYSSATGIQRNGHFTLGFAGFAFTEIDITLK